MEVFSRYEALGMPLPDVETMCKGDCEGTGWVPIFSTDPDPKYRASWDDACKAAADHDCDGWHFVKCLDCGGTGKRP